MFQDDWKTRRLARGMLALEPQKAGQTTLAFMDDAILRGDFERARMWHAVLEYITAFRPPPAH